jgi:uncharacterized RDD family membrane protein YckC
MPPAAQRRAGVARRLLSFVYEGVLLFGIVMGVALLYGIATRQRHALEGTAGLQAALFVTLGAYFIYFWSAHGQTLAMKTWRLRLQGPDGKPPSPGRATVRYLLAWLWFAPALAVLAMSGLRSGATASAVVLAGVLAYAALARLRADRQFLHDVLCGTQLIDERPAAAGGSTMAAERP